MGTRSRTGAALTAAGCTTPFGVVTMSVAFTGYGTADMDDNLFKEAVASTAGTTAEDVEILNKTQQDMRRRVLVTTVGFQVLAATSEMATSISTALSNTIRLNAALISGGLPSAAVVNPPSLDLTLATTPAPIEVGDRDLDYSGLSDAELAGVVVGSVAGGLLLLGACWALYWMRICKPPPPLVVSEGTEAQTDDGPLHPSKQQEQQQQQQTLAPLVSRGPCTRPKEGPSSLATTFARRDSRPS